MSDRPPPWRAPLEAALEDRVEVARPTAGGDIGASYRVELASGRSIFLKCYAQANLETAADTIDIAACEARGLAWLDGLDETDRPLRVARVLANGSDWLALEWIERSEPCADYADRLGEGLARIHAAAPDRFGLDHDNWIGSLPQANAPTDDWAEFYAERRIAPLERRAREAALLPASLSRELDHLKAQLPKLISGAEPPARLHGDLWAGNVLPDERGRPCLVDPACYGGHREVDLAMMKLFGGFESRVFEAYAQTRPLEPGAEARVGLYQVYPLLVHVCLFGGGYVDRLRSAIRSALR